MSILRAARRLAALTATFVFLSVVAWPALAQAQTVSVVPADTTVVAGETITVRVATDGSTDLHAYHLVYGYDSTKLEFLSAAVGDLAASHNPQAYPLLGANSVTYDVALLGSSASGPGILAYFTFKVLVTGTSAITPQTVDFRNSLNQSTTPTTVGASVTGNAALQVTLATLTPVSCNGGSNGAIDITPSGGVGAYTYLWSNSATTQDLTGVTANTYSVTVTDVNGRTATGSWAVTQPPALTLSLVKTDPLCVGGSTGSMTATGGGGTGTLTYSKDGTTFQSSGEFTGLAAASYTITVKDANGCTLAGGIALADPPALTLSLAKTDITCNGAGNGTITATAGGGTGTLTYSKDGTTFQSSNTFSGLASSSYTITVKDANGCTTTAGATVLDPPALTLSLAATNPLCAGSSTGSITATAGGGMPPLTYSKDGTTFQSSNEFSGLAASPYTITVKDVNGCTLTAGTSLADPAALGLSLVKSDPLCAAGSTGSITATGLGGTPPLTYSKDGTTFQPSDTFTGLAAGSYTITVRDANLCTHTTGAVLVDPPALTLSLAKTDVACTGGASGEITATGGGGTGTLTYSKDGTTFQSSNVFNGLAAASYTITVKDANGCTLAGGITVLDLPAVTLSLAKTDVSCNGVADGTITATGGGGTAPLTYSKDGTTFQPSNVFAGLVAASYTITVKDANGCTTTAGVSVTQPDPLTVSEVHSTTCSGAPDGSITLTVGGGTTSYTYAWTGSGGFTSTSKDLSALAAGTYSVTVTDAHGCIATLAPVTIAVRSYTITPTANAGGTITAGSVQTVNCGDSPSFTIAANACFTFTGLVVDGLPVAPTSPYTFPPVHADHTITASFTAVPLALPVTTLAAVRSTSGNSGSSATGTTQVTVNYTAPGDGNTVEIWRKGYGNYPEYDDGTSPGSVPALPAVYPPAGWTKTSLTASGQADVPDTRDYWYYVACSVNSCGQGTVSTVMTGGTLDYFLGDVHNGSANCAGNNVVDMGDISFLGGNYGATLSNPAADPLGCLDVGPTSTSWVDGRPLTDNRIEFEDLVLFAINFGQVSAPAMNARPAKVATGTSTLTLTHAAMPAVGETFDAVLNFQGTGDVQGLSAKLAFNPAVVEPVGVAGGSLLAQQAGPAQVFTSEPGTVDVAVFGNGLTLAGTGDLARMTFRVKAAGDPGIALGTVRARDAGNRAVTLLTPLAVNSPPLPARLELAPSYPNPFTNALTVVFGMPRDGRAKLAVFDIQGRTVRHLLDGAVPAGWTRATWDGRSDDGLMLAPGAYVIRLSAEGRVITKSVRLVR